MLESLSIDYRNLPLFENIDAENASAMMDCFDGQIKEFEKGEIILMEQENVKYIGVILQGTVHMIKEDLWGNNTLLTYMSRGELLGETFAVQKGQRSYVAFRAATKVSILMLSLYNIIHPCDHNCGFHNQISQNLFDLLGVKNLQLMEKIEVVSKGTLRDKIMAYLSLQAQKQNSRYIHVPLSRTQMADYLCANRSAMTRELAAMADDGIIEYDHNTFVIL